MKKLSFLMLTLHLLDGWTGYDAQVTKREKLCPVFFFYYYTRGNHVDELLWGGDELMMNKKQLKAWGGIKNENMRLKNYIKL